MKKSKRDVEIKILLNGQRNTQKLTIAEKEAKKGILKLSSSMLIDKNVRNSCNAGYLFLQDIYYPLGLDKICTSISKKIN